MYIRATNRLCIYEKFKLDYSSSDLFKSYELNVIKLTTSRSQTVLDSSCSEETTILPACMCAVADTKTMYKIWFVYIDEVEEAIDEKLDSYGHAIVPGHIMRAICLRMGDTKKGRKLELMSKDGSCMYREYCFSRK